MNSFVTAVETVQIESRTKNGMKTFTSSKSTLVDLFFAIGASRGKDLSPLFCQAFNENSTLALRMLAWARDIRGGAGEREVVRKLLLALERNYPADLDRILPFLPEYGRWDDLLVFKTQPIKEKAWALIKSALQSKNQLAAKWMPRQGPVAAELRQWLGLSPKSYRKLLVGLSNVVETKMCSDQWTDINYSHVPSLAASRYQTAFKRHDPAGIEKYKAAIKSGDAKVNAAAVYPYDIIKSLKQGGDIGILQSQWNALPQYIGDELVLPMCDVSGSMTIGVSGLKKSNDTLTCLDVCVSLGLYLADKNKGPFKDMFLTFSDKPKLEILKGSLVDKLAQLQSADWEMNTNLHAAFDEILTYAVKGKVAPADMPAYLLILSDMEFDACANHDDSALEMIERKFSNAGYKVPNIIFWNLNARSGNMPVKFDTENTALVSGFSPSIMKSILSADCIDPLNIMLQVLNSPRYSLIQ